MVSSAFPNPDDSVAKEWHELAKLTGYKPNESELKTATVAVAQPGLSEQEQSERRLLDDEDLEDDDEETKTPLHQNPFAKLVLAGAMVGTGVGALALFLATINGQVQQATTATSAAENRSSTTADTQESEVGRLKTINGLGTQAQLLNQANQPSVRRTTQAKPGTPAQTAPAQAKPAQNRPASPTPVPMPIAARPLSVAPSPVLRAAPRTDPSAASASFAASNTTPVDPAQQWETAKNLGSYGTGATAVLSTSVARTVTASAPMDEPMTIASASVPSPQAVTPALAVAPPEATTMSSGQMSSGQMSSGQMVQPVATTLDLQYQSDVQALMTGVRQPVTQIAPGATAAGTLRTPIAWAQDLDPEQQPQRISVELAQDIPATDGSPAIPAGSQLVARITAISENGMMQIEAQQAIVQTASGTQTVNLPPGAVLITGQGGNPLIAESRKPGARNSLGDDIEVAAMGALGQVGSLLNRPANESTMTSPYLSSTNVTNGSTSIVGGILEGGFNALMESTQARQQQRQQEMQQRPNLWFVPAGQTVQVFVNAPVQIAIGQGV